MDPKVRRAGLDGRVPQHRGNAGIGDEGTPTSRPGKMVRGRGVKAGRVTGKHRRISAGGVAGETDVGQAGASQERISSDVGGSWADGDIGQAEGIIERIGSDADDTLGDDEVGQAGATLKRALLDVGDTVGDGESSHADAITERVYPDVGHAAADGEAG